MRALVGSADDDGDETRCGPNLELCQLESRSSYRRRISWRSYRECHGDNVDVMNSRGDAEKA